MFREGMEDVFMVSKEYFIDRFALHDSLNKTGVFKHRHSKGIFLLFLLACFTYYYIKFNFNYVNIYLHFF